MTGKAGVGLERSMNGIMGAVEKKRTLFLHRGRHLRGGFTREGFSEEDFGTMIRGQMRHGMAALTGRLTKVFRPLITTGLADGASAYIDIEAEVLRILPL